MRYQNCTGHAAPHFHCMMHGRHWDGMRERASSARCKKLTGALQHPGVGGRPATWSQFSQDFVVAALFATVIQPASRVYVDLAANNAIYDSNTYFLDKCLGWRGLCIEANAFYATKHHTDRTSILHQGCVSDIQQTQSCSIGAPVLLWVKLVGWREIIPALTRSFAQVDLSYIANLFHSCWAQRTCLTSTTCR